MSSGTTAVVIVAILLIIVALGAVVMTERRRRLQQRFGPEYDRAVEEQNSRIRAEAELTERQRRVRKLDIKPLSESARRQYLADWARIQEQFVDAPAAAVGDAYGLVTTVMQARGYPIEDDKQVTADLSVEHAKTVGHFRDAREITRQAVGGDAETEQLRQALIHYRALFSDPLGEPDADAVRANGAARAEVTPADSTTADSTPADTSPADAALADAAPAGAGPVATSPADADDDAEGDDGVAVGRSASDRTDNE
jgi:hypothetical protein